MPNTKKSPAIRSASSKRATVAKTAIRNNIVLVLQRRLADSRLVRRVNNGVRAFLARRPHRSFRRTYRRDYARSLDMPGYISFTHRVNKLLWENKKLFIYVILSYALITIAITNLSSESLYAQMRETVNESGTEMFEGFWGEIGKAGLLLIGGVTGSYQEAATDSPANTQTYAVILGLLTWLTTVWLLRVLLAGRKPKVRDGLYNAGSPIVSTALVASLAILQLLPIALALFGYNSAVASGLLEGGGEAMVFWSAAALLTILSLYWLTATLIALVVVTLPGMYPMQAIRTAGDLVVGRRLRILLRILWMLIVVALSWIVIVIPMILFDGWLKSVWQAVAWLPIVPITLLIMSSVTIIWIASYIYLLYRRIVEDDAHPA
ncbi:MAG TPA: hypothetical protein VGO98_01810 [Candidatus Saccharimonadales bacterium]|nr:hypothetical protein [Candidatus Saccharimonadales bacterium]